jgi:hypothetical protein
MGKLLMTGVVALAATTFAPLAHARPAGDICDTAKCDQMFLSRVDSSNFHPANDGGDQQWIPMAKQVCGVFQSQWGTVGSPQIFQNAMSLVQANISGLSNPDVGSFIYFSQVAYCPWSERG